MIRKKEKALLLNQQENNLSPVKKKKKFQFWDKSLLLKQTLISAWKSKLQLVILLLLTAFATSIVTGSWISYQRIIDGEKTLQLDDANFDAVLPYTSWEGGRRNVVQIANQAFSLSLGRLYYQDSDSTGSVAVYFDNTTIGREIKPLLYTDLKITYTKEGNHITGVSDFQWANPNHPLDFNIEVPNVKASIYGQLMIKAQQTNNLKLKKHYQQAADDLYRNLFVNFSAGQILESLQVYFTDWIKANSSDGHLDLGDDKFTEFLVGAKINFNPASEGTDKDLRIPSEVNVASDIDDLTGVLATRLVKETDSNPRLTAEYGMNGQWMRIYRKFDITPRPGKEKLSDFSNQYSSPNNYNLMNDSFEPNTYSYYLAQAVAALQNRRINVVNQFVTTAGIDATGKSLTVKVVNLGLKKNYNDVNLKIFEGVYPSSRNELAISPQYARTYGIKPGDKLTISGKSFIITGIGGDAYNVYPILNELDPLPNTRNEFIVYCFPDAFHDSSWVAAKDATDTTLMYFIPWKDVPVPDFDVSYFNDYFQKSIFSDTKRTDLFQYDYNNYLIEKYLYNNPDYPSKYRLSLNLVVDKNNSQFSNYSRGKTMLDSVLLGFTYIAYIGVTFLVAIIIFITYLIIKKAIQKNQVSMGILKSAGYSTWKILVSFLAYPLIVLLIAIPIGWLVGLAIQVYFTEIFNTLFILPYNVLSYNLIPMLISIALICGFVLITTLITGYRILQKQPIVLMSKNNNDIDIESANKVSWLQKKLKNNFKSRFLLSLSRTSWKKITITSVVIAIATLAITSTVSVPATITSMKDNYFKTQKYNNYYQYQTPIPNMPLSKYGLYAWNNLNKPTEEPYYPVSAAMPWAEDVIINGQGVNGQSEKIAYYNPVAYDKAANDGNGNFEDILKIYENIDPNDPRINQIIDEIGKHLLDSENGALDINFLAWSYSWLGGRVFSNALLKDLAVLDLTTDKSFSNSLINFVVTILPSIIGVSNPGIPPSPDAIAEILKQTLPGFMRQILDRKGVSAYDYFAIGHNSIAYNPNYNQAIGGAEEELVTQFQLGSADTNLVDRGFLDVEGINPETKMLVMDSNLVRGLKYNELDLVIPMVINRSFAARYNLEVGSVFNAAPKIKTLYYKNKDDKYVPITKDSWYYGDNPDAQDPEGKKAIWEKSANKWNYRGEKKVGDTQFNDSYGYEYNGVYDNNGQRVLSDEPETWNDVNKIWLKLPDDIVEEAKSGALRTADVSGTESFDVKNIAASEGSPWIKPFSYDVTDKHHGNDHNPVDLLLNRAPEWYGGMLDLGYLYVDDNLHDGNFATEIGNDMATWWENIVSDSSPITKYHVIGIQDSYDTAKAYIDQKWANLVAGYSHYGDRSNTKDPTYTSGIYQWFSGKLSAADDIYDLIGRMSFKRRADDYTMYSMLATQGNSEELTVANSDLLFKKREMLNKMADITLSASLLFIVTAVICSILIVMMITDSFTEQFRRFMSHMKAEGYTNWEINSFTLGIFTPWVMVGYAAGYGLGFLIIYGFIQIVSRLAGLAFPFAFIWWIIPLSFAIIALIYFSTFIINTYQLNKMDLVGLLKTDE